MQKVLMVAVLLAGISAAVGAQEQRAAVVVSVDRPAVLAMKESPPVTMSVTIENLSAESQVVYLEGRRLGTVDTQQSREFRLPERYQGGYQLQLRGFASNEQRTTDEITDARSRLIVRDGGMQLFLRSR